VNIACALLGEIAPKLVNMHKCRLFRSLAGDKGYISA
jgi:hypothetical protein